MDKIKWDFIQLWINKKAFLLKKNDILLAYVMQKSHFGTKK